jgi:hypothetical protein
MRRKSMNRYYVLILTALVFTGIGCTAARQTSLDVPMKLDVGDHGSPSGTIRIQSGQLIVLELGCPPIELRDASGKVLRQLKYTAEPQRLIAPPGKYSIVIFDPGTQEYVVRIEVICD